MNFKKSFFEVLLLNNEKETMDFVLSEGKSPKPVSPIYFVDDTERSEDTNVTENQIIGGNELCQN